MPLIDGAQGLLRASLPRSVVELLDEAPLLHGSLGRPKPPESLWPALEIVTSDQGFQRLRVVETGAGVSSLVWLAMGWEVTSVEQDAAVVEAVAEMARSRNIDAGRWSRVAGRPEVALYGLLGRTFDVALMDRARGWPGVFVEFCYLNATLRQGGVLLVDDTHLHSKRELVELLRMQPGYTILRDVTNLRAFRKDSDARFLPDIGKEPYLAGKRFDSASGSSTSRHPIPPSWADARRRRQSALEAAGAALNAGDTIAARAELGRLEGLDIGPLLLEATDGWLRQLAGSRTIVAATDPRRAPTDDEVVVIYGNYPLSFHSIVSNNPVRRHVSDFGVLEHDVVESDARWSGVERILVINRDDRPDRWEATLRELARAQAPLDRVERVSAILPESHHSEALRGHVACLRSHLAVVERAQAAECPTCLVLEDDFSFTSDLEQHLTDLSLFTQRGYPYWICLLATHHDGPVVPVDDLVAESHQAVTTTAGYLLSSEGAKRLTAVFSDALPRLIATGEEVYVADRCWAVLQEPGRFLVFRRKVGLQAAGFSDITRKITRYRF